LRSEQELRDAVRRSAESLGSAPDLAGVRRRARSLRTRRALGGVVLLGLLAAAVVLPLRALAPIGEPSPPPPQPAEEPDAQAPAGVFFPTLTEPREGGPDVGGGGVLEEWHGCLRLGEGLVLWPYSWSVEKREGRLTILDDGGRAAFAVGDLIAFERAWSVWGGRDGLAGPERAIGEPIPHRCRSASYLMWSGEHRVLDEERGAAMPKETLARGADLGRQWRLLVWGRGPMRCLALDPLGGLDCYFSRHELVVRGTPASTTRAGSDVFLWGTAPAGTARITGETDDGRIARGRLFPIEGMERYVPFLVIVEDVRSVLLDATDADGNSIDQYRWYP
jgi:hypothetical protein